MTLGRLFGCEPLPVDEQANPDLRLYKCTDGVMRTAWGRNEFEKHIEWWWFGWRRRPEDDPRS